MEVAKESYDEELLVDVHTMEHSMEGPNSTLRDERFVDELRKELDGGILNRKNEYLVKKIRFYLQLPKLSNIEIDILKTLRERISKHSEWEEDKENAMPGLKKKGRKPSKRKYPTEFGRELMQKPRPRRANVEYVSKSKRPRKTTKFVQEAILDEQENETLLNQFPKGDEPNNNKVKVAEEGSND